MKLAYWIVAGLLALLYLYAGGLKLIRSKEQLRPMMQWVDTMPLAQVRGLGAIEIVGAPGLILPPLLGIAPLLALLAAIGLLVLQILAVRVHLGMGDAPGEMAINGLLIVGAIAAAVLVTAWL